MALPLRLALRRRRRRRRGLRRAHPAQVLPARPAKRGSHYGGQALPLVSHGELGPLLLVPELVLVVRDGARVVLDLGRRALHAAEAPVGDGEVVRVDAGRDPEEVLRVPLLLDLGQLRVVGAPEVALPVRVADPRLRRVSLSALGPSAVRNPPRSGKRPCPAPDPAAPARWASPRPSRSSARTSGATSG